VKCGRKPEKMRTGIYRLIVHRFGKRGWLSAENLHQYPNILNRDFTASKPNQKWVTDITYIRTKQGWAYLSTIKDLYDGFIVAHQLANK